MSNYDDMGKRAYIYLEVASRLAMVFLLPMMAWLLVTVQKHEVEIAEIKSSQFTTVDGLGLQSQINELAFTTQAAIESIRRVSESTRVELKDQSESLRRIELHQRGEAGNAGGGRDNGGNR